MTRVLVPGSLSWDDLRAIWEDAAPLEFPAEVWPTVARSSATVATIVGRGAPAYGINTGFGKLAHTRIADTDLQQLQRNLILSHAAGTGPALPDPVVRLVMVTKAASLARGFSGVRPVVIQTLLALYHAQILPVIPAKGSVGASGDLAPLSHMTLALLGEGEVTVAGVRQPAATAMAAAGIAPLDLAAKEGLALINGTQVSTALAVHAWLETGRLLQSAVVIGALSVDAARGSDAPFDPRIHALRGQAGQIDVADAMRALMVDSQIRQSHLENDERVQDPYSLRCQPQVMGACLDVWRQAGRTLLVEANGVTDNPLVFADTEEVLSGGNFHAEPVAFASDQLALVIAEVGALAERRVALLIDANLSGLPAFLVPSPGLHSGFMIAHVTAAALASQNKSLAHPHVVDSLPTSANQEDHVSMATSAGWRLLEMLENTQTIVAIEWLAAAQGVDFHRPLQTSPRLLPVHARLREHVPFYDQDRYFAPDIAAALALVQQGAACAHNQDLFARLPDGTAGDA